MSFGLQQPTTAIYIFQFNSTLSTDKMDSNLISSPDSLTGSSGRGTDVASDANTVSEEIIDIFTNFDEEEERERNGIGAQLDDPLTNELTAQLRGEQVPTESKPPGMEPPPTLTSCQYPEEKVPLIFEHNEQPFVDGAGQFPSSFPQQFPTNVMSSAGYSAIIHPAFYHPNPFLFSSPSFGCGHYHYGAAPAVDRFSVGECCAAFAPPPVAPGPVPPQPQQATVASRQLPPIEIVTTEPAPKKLYPAQRHRGSPKASPAEKIPSNRGRRNNSKIVGCLICGKKFVETHMYHILCHISAHDPTLKRYECSECTFSSMRMDKMREHITSRCTIASCQVRKDNVYRELLSRMALQCFPMMHDRVLAYHEHEGTSVSRIRRQIPPGPENTVQCKICERTLKFAGGSRIHHAKTHSSMFRYRCSACGKQGHMKDNIRVHITSVHEGRAEIQDKIGPEMREEYRRILEECFPEHTDDSSSESTLSPESSATDAVKSSTKSGTKSYSTAKTRLNFLPPSAPNHITPPHRVVKNGSNGTTTSSHAHATRSMTTRQSQNDEENGRPRRTTQNNESNDKTQPKLSGLRAWAHPVLTMDSPYIQRLWSGSSMFVHNHNVMNQTMYPAFGSQYGTIVGHPAATTNEERRRSCSQAPPILTPEVRIPSPVCKTPNKQAD